MVALLPLGRNGDGDLQPMLRLRISLFLRPLMPRGIYPTRSEPMAGFNLFRVASIDLFLGFFESGLRSLWGIPAHYLDVVPLSRVDQR